MKLVIDFEPWKPLPFAIYFESPSTICGEVLERFETEDEARRWCEAHRNGKPRIAEYEL